MAQKVDFGSYLDLVKKLPCDLLGKRSHGRDCRRREGTTDQAPQASVSGRVGENQCLVPEMCKLQPRIIGRGVERTGEDLDRERINGAEAFRVPLDPHHVVVPGHPQRVRERSRMDAVAVFA
jgi:hypothetical protein